MTVFKGWSYSGGIVSSSRLIIAMLSMVLPVKSRPGIPPPEGDYQDSYESLAVISDRKNFAKVAALATI
jgi:hypothetical protein